jgi:hypothetical protein
MNDSEQTSVVENPFANRVAEQPPKKASILSQIKNRKRRRPVFGLVYGPSGIGKSTFASLIPDIVLIPLERGLDQITVDKFDSPKSFEEFWSILVALDTEEHPYKAIGLDTIDALELLIFKRVCIEGKVKSIEEYGGGYGKGYMRAREIWTGVLTKLTEMSERFTILMLAHSQLRTINDPVLNAGFDMHRIKVQEKSAEIIRQMVDLILFVNFELAIDKESPKARKGRGIIGDRVFYTQPQTGLEAKNRYNLESPLEFSWAALNEGINKFYDR